MKEFNIKGCFICNFCRDICDGQCNDIKLKLMDGTIKYGTEEYEKNKDLDCDRKQIIGCLGKYCDKKCKLNNEDAYKNIDISVFIKTIKYLGDKVNKLIEENNELKEKIVKE